MNFTEFKIKSAGRPKGSGTSKKSKREQKAQEEQKRQQEMLSPDGAKYVMRLKKPMHLSPIMLEKEFREKFLKGEFKVKKCFLIKDWRWEEFDHDLEYAYKIK